MVQRMELFLTPDTVGTYYYICQYHGAMVGTINATANTSKHVVELQQQMVLQYIQMIRYVLLLILMILIWDQ